MFFFMIGSFMLTSCVKEEPVSCVLPSVETTSNSPVISGGTINLSTPLIQDTSYSYSWSGPNGFSSSIPNPTINNATAAMAGDYKLKVKKGICESIESVVTMEVIPNPVACNPTNNTMSYSGGLLDPITFTSIYSSVSSGNYTLNADGNDDIELIFYNGNTPATGLYNIKDWTSTLASNEVGLTLLKSGYFFSANSGVVSVTLVNNKLTFAFCEVLFNSSQAFPVVVKGSAKITKP